MDVTPKEKKKQPKKKTKAPKKILLPKDAGTETKQIKKRSKKPTSNKGTGLIYLGHIPHGFYEEQMKSYFEQFGVVLNTKVCRSSKTGRSRGYGFVEFKDEEVAKIAAESMNNYLMFNKIIKCSYIPPEERKKKFLRTPFTANNFPTKKNRMDDVKNKTKNFLSLDRESYIKKTEKKIDEFKKFFKDRGIDFTVKFAKDATKNKTTKSPAPKNKPKKVSSSEPDDQFGVLEIDESDNDIHFKTPPNAKKVIKKSTKQDVKPKKFNDFTNNKTETKKKVAPKQKNKKSTEQKKQKSKIGVSSASKNIEKKQKTKVKAKPLISSKKMKLIEKDISELMKDGNRNSKGKIDVVVSKMTKGNSSTKLKAKKKN